jgi:metal-responsive CopG/Arc/MetJ family transcriptional regulator
MDSSMSNLKTKQKSLRIVIPEALYNRIKMECTEYGDISKLIRQLLIKYLEQLRDLHEESR